MRPHPFLIAAGSTVVALVLAFWLWSSLRTTTPYQIVRVDPDVEPERVVPGREPYVFDPVVGFRAPRSTTAEITMAALGSTELQTVSRRSNNLGFVREDDLTGELSGPRVLVVGDSHTLGVVGTDDNLGPVLERSLRAHDGLRQALVLNAGCGYYSLYQHVLRVRSLVDTIEPRAVVVVVFMGNDFLDLENQRVPHLARTDDGTIVERPKNPSPPPETTSSRRAALRFPDDDAIRYYMESAFWQGLNQAKYLHEDPRRIDALLGKAARCVALLRDLAAAEDFDVVWALLPSVDVVFPDKIRTASPVVEEVVASGVQVTLYDGFRTLLEEHGERFVDLRESFTNDGGLDLYAADFHIWIRGHRLVAERVAPLVRDACSR